MATAHSDGVCVVKKQLKWLAAISSTHKRNHLFSFSDSAVSLWCWAWGTRATKSTSDAPKVLPRCFGYKVAMASLGQTTRWKSQRKPGNGLEKTHEAVVLLWGLFGWEFWDSIQLSGVDGASVFVFQMEGRRFDPWCTQCTLNSADQWARLDEELFLKRLKDRQN